MRRRVMAQCGAIGFALSFRGRPKAGARNPYAAAIRSGAAFVGPRCRGVWIPGSLALLAPRNDDKACGLARILWSAPGTPSFDFSSLPGLSPSTAYRIRTLWHHRTWGWLDVTTRTVTTDPSHGAPFSLRYEKGTGMPYCVTFYWKNVPTVPGATAISLLFSRKFFSAWFVEDKSPDVSTASFNLFTGEYHYQWCKFYESRTYRAIVNIYVGNNVAASSNQIQWH